MARPKPRRRGSETGKPAKTCQVFVSHATTFRDDRDIQGGDDIPDEIRRQIQRSKELVVLLTPCSKGREWVTLEIGAAWGWGGGGSRRKHIVVVLCHVDVDTIPAILKSKKAINLNDLGDYVAEVGRRVKEQRP
jgi:hypothetical protein